MDDNIPIVKGELLRSDERNRNGPGCRVYNRISAERHRFGEQKERITMKATSSVNLEPHLRLLGYGKSPFLKPEVMKTPIYFYIPIITDNTKYEK